MTRSLYGLLDRRHGPDRSVTRRDVLAAACAASAALAIGACAAPRRRSALEHRTVVVGAGFAGLACALELRARGSRVTVLEARARVGGRVHTLSDLARGKTVEAGGEFIGSNHPLWLAHARRFGLELVEESVDESLDSPVVLAGRRLSSDESRALYEEMTECFGALTERARAIDADEPWTARDAVALDREPISSWIDALGASPVCKRAIAAQLASDNGVDVRAQSTLAHLAMIRGGGLEKYWTESEVYRCRGGNQRLAVTMAEELEPEELLLDAPVVAIDLAKNAARVTCASGRVFNADAVVLATPPSTWDSIRFDPPLPSELAPQMGRSVKFLAGVRARYWKARGLSPYAFGDGEIGFTWESTADQPGDDSAVLTAFSSAGACDRARARNGAELRSSYSRELESLLPGFAEHFGDARFVDWPGDPRTRAGYSFAAPGEVTTVAPLLRRGIGRLAFAGEHASTRFPGYMEGALDAGLRTATKIASSFTTAAIESQASVDPERSREPAASRSIAARRG